MITIGHPHRHLPILSIWVLVLLNGIKCQDNEGACQSGTQCKPTVHTFMEDTARKLLNTEILPEHTSKLDQMFDDKFATVKSHLESHFNDQLKAQAKVTSLKIKEFGWLLNSLACLNF